jgi:hypothetical protein
VTTVDGAGASVTDTIPLTVSEAQYDLSGGYTLGQGRLEVRDRLRAIGGERYNSVSARFDVATRIAVLSAFAENDGFRGSTNADAGIRLQPLPFVAVSGSVAQTTAHSGNTSFPSSRSARGEVGLKLFRPWVSAGVVTVDNAGTPPPVVYDSLLQGPAAGRSTGTLAGIRGPIGWGLGIDAYLTRWKSERAYRPRYQSRSEINFSSTFPRRFPSGNFEVRAAAVYEYRGRNSFTLAAGDVEVSTAKTISALLEIRVMRAVVSYQQRNVLAYQHEIIPGFEMPRVLAIYGVRWEFWN